MKKILIFGFITGLVFLSGPAAVSAQDNDAMRVIPVELYSCSYNEGKGPEDLDKVIVKWNEWADKIGVDDYSAWTLTPFYFGPNQEFDVIWLGAAKDAVALGKAQDAYNAENVGLHGDFNEVLSCDAHVNYASLNYKAAPEGATPGNGVLTFSDCKYKEGATYEALGKAMNEWSKHLADGGSKATIFHWYAAYGGGGEEYDFKWLEAHKNFEELGADYESYGNGGGWEINAKLFSQLIDCDASRAYLAQNRRYVQLR